MNNIKYLFCIISLITVVLFSTSCEKKQGCTNPAALNYNVNAEEDDGSCIYKSETPEIIDNSDKLVGTWQVVETVSCATTTFNEYYEAKIVRVNKDTISISAVREINTDYFYNNAHVFVNWDSKELIGPFTMKGVIINKNKIIFDYIHDMNSPKPSIVNQEYTR